MLLSLLVNNFMSSAKRTWDSLILCEKQLNRYTDTTSAKNMRQTRRIMALMLKDLNLEYTPDQIVEKTGLTKPQVLKALFEIKRGKLVVVKRKIKINRPPWRTPLYGLNPERVERARELVNRRDD